MRKTSKIASKTPEKFIQECFALCLDKSRLEHILEESLAQMVGCFARETTFHPRGVGLICPDFTFYENDS